MICSEGPAGSGRPDGARPPEAQALVAEPTQPQALPRRGSFRHPKERSVGPGVLNWHRDRLAKTSPHGTPDLTRDDGPDRAGS